MKRSIVMIMIVHLIAYYFSIETKEVELYYSSSTNETINNIFYIYREFVVITKHYEDIESCSVNIIHEQIDGSWINLPATNISYFIQDNIAYDIWQYQIKWLSLGSPYQFHQNFAVKYYNGSSVYYDNNQYHNYNLKNNDGFYLNKNRSIKLKEASLTFDYSTNTTTLEGIILMKNLEYLKYCNVYIRYLNIHDQTGDCITKGRFLSKNNRYGVEKWVFEKAFSGIINYLSFYATVVYHPRIDNEIIDDNFNRQYVLTIDKPVINHDNNN